MCEYVHTSTVMMEFRGIGSPGPRVTDGYELSDTTPANQTPLNNSVCS